MSLMRRTVVLLLALVAGVSACGGSDGSSTTDDGTVASPAATDAQHQTGPASAPLTEDQSAEVANASVPPATPSLGACHVEVTGARTVSWDATGGLDATGIDYWLSDDDRAQIPADFGFFFILNCNSDVGLVTFGAGSLASAETIPLGPGSYELPAATSGVGSETVLTGGVSIEESDGPLWGLADGAALVIAEFDHEHIAGTFDFAAIDVFGGTDGELHVTGSFDYRNPK
jgi:hypothetical protein